MKEKISEKEKVSRKIVKAMFENMKE